MRGISAVHLTSWLGRRPFMLLISQTLLHSTVMRITTKLSRGQAAMRIGRRLKRLVRCATHKPKYRLGFCVHRYGHRQRPKYHLDSCEPQCEHLRKPKCHLDSCVPPYTQKSYI